MSENKNTNPKGDSIEEQNEELKKMDYPAKEDIYNKEEHISLDEDGNPITKPKNTDTMRMDLDVPGSEYDNKMEDIGEEDEENNYYSGADQNN